MDVGPYPLSIRLRFQHPSAIYHVTTQGAGPCAIYRGVEDREIWLVSLGKVVDRFGLKLYSWCEMTTHYHLLLEAPHCNLDEAVRWLNGVYAQGFNKRHERKGHLFGARYESRVIQSEDHLLSTARYIALNPVEAGICATPASWRWSSYLTTITDGRPWPAIAAWEILRRFGADPVVAREGYRRFVEAGLPLTRAA